LEALKYFCVVMTCLIILVPLAWTVVLSFETYRDLITMRFPFTPTFENYISLFHPIADLPTSMTPFIRNSILVTAIAVVMIVPVGSLAAYAICTFKFKWRIDRALLALSLLGRMVPLICLTPSLFLMTWYLGLYDTWLGLILLYVNLNLPFTIWIMKAFIDELPKEIEEAALIDGCTRLQALKNVVLPLVTPGLFTAALFAFLFTWNEFLLALVITHTAQVQPIPIFLSFLSQEFIALYGEMGAAVTLFVIPVIVLTFFLQKNLVRGLTFGAVKG